MRRSVTATDDTQTVVVRDATPPSEDSRWENMLQASISLKRRVERKREVRSALREYWMREWVRGWPDQTDEEDTQWDRLSRISTEHSWGVLIRLGSRVQQNIMAALRLGHAPVGLHRHRVARAPSADCACQQGHESISHFLLDCTQWRVQRRQMLSTVRTVLADAQQRRQQRIPLTESLLLGAAKLTVKEYVPVLRAVTAFVLATRGDSWRYIYAR